MPARSPQDDIASSECGVDVDFFETLGIELSEGRLFEARQVGDSLRHFVLNETAARQLNLENPIGAEVNWERDGPLVRGRVIGTVKDFHFQSLHEPIRPLLFVLSSRFNFVLIRTEMNDVNNRMAAIEEIYRKFEPIFDFNFTFLDDQLQKQYVAEERLGSVIAIFSAIAMVIASAGLFGMALLSFYQKVKEISIRKVLGATTANLLYLLLRNFTALIIVATLAATPLTWWVMTRWLENFSYRTSVGAGVFILSGAVLLLVSWLTLSYLTVKTARLNPAETLKSE